MIAQVHQLMMKPCTTLIPTRLSRLMTLQPKNKNDTRWSKPFAMLQGHTHLRGYVVNLSHAEMDALFLSPAEKCKVEDLLRQCT